MNLFLFVLFLRRLIRQTKEEQASYMEKLPSASLLAWVCKSLVEELFEEGLGSNNGRMCYGSKETVI